VLSEAQQIIMLDNPTDYDTSDAANACNDRAPSNGDPSPLNNSPSFDTNRARDPSRNPADEPPQDRELLCIHVVRAVGVDLRVVGFGHVVRGVG